ncbi:hypothetical protein R3P38DRAFT_3256049 [Favolaschia claudopus]|uniref:Uncharacterized protein n=1 Tax=Favolaschia claudopus TaxID=2862362 RepID=A0AAW0DG55_9AGAR
MSNATLSMSCNTAAGQHTALPALALVAHASSLVGGHDASTHDKEYEHATEENMPVDLVVKGDDSEDGGADTNSDSDSHSTTDLSSPTAAIPRTVRVKRWLQQCPSPIAFTDAVAGDESFVEVAELLAIDDEDEDEHSSDDEDEDEDESDKEEFDEDEDEDESEGEDGVYKDSETGSVRRTKSNQNILPTRSIENTPSTHLIPSPAKFILHMYKHRLPLRLVILISPSSSCSSSASSPAAAAAASTMTENESHHNTVKRLKGGAGREAQGEDLASLGGLAGFLSTRNGAPALRS